MALQLPRVWTATAILLCFLSSCQANPTPTVPELAKRSAPCPAIWTTIAADLRSEFGNNCSDNARTALRLAFHDAGGYSSKTAQYAPASGGVDGSIMLSTEEMNREVNSPLPDFINGFMFPRYNKYKEHGISVADFIVAVADVAVKSCPGGPSFTFLVGRQDSDQPAPDGNIPNGFGPGSDAASLISLFADKGIDQIDLVALLGAHSIARVFSQEANGIPSGTPLDSTVGQYDLAFYQEMTNSSTPPPGVKRLDSDVNLANNDLVTAFLFRFFAGNLGGWVTTFNSAMSKLVLLGLSSDFIDGMADCTPVI